MRVAQEGGSLEQRVHLADRLAAGPFPVGQAVPRDHDGDVVPERLLGQRQGTHDVGEPASLGERHHFRGNVHDPHESRAFPKRGTAPAQLLGEASLR